MTNNILRIATRKSPLALWQAEYVKTALQTVHPNLSVELVGIVTEGDKLLSTSLAKIGGKGLFVKELEHALLTQQADIAVHSIKDMPVNLPEGFTLAAICERDDPRDVFVANRYKNFMELPQGAKIGTSSLRRASQLKALRQDLIFETLRGNVGTRLQKLESGQFDGIILAAAGIKRLGLTDRICQYFTPEQMLPAVGQGAIGIECRQDDAQIFSWLTAIEHSPTRLCITAERAMNRALGGSCQLPIAAYAELQRDQIHLRGLVADPYDGSLLFAEQTANAHAAEQLGQEVAEQLLAQGANAIIEKIK